MEKERIADQPENVLINSPLHKGMLLFQIPASWPTWQVALAVLALSASTSLIWWFVTGHLLAALVAGSILGLFVGIDGLFLYMLPVRGISYGPWRSQLFALVIPRTVAAMLVSLVAALGGMGWGLVGLISVEFLGTAALIWGAQFEPMRINLTRLTVETDRLESGSEPIRILHISDLHVERLTKRERKLLQLVEQARADLILITGDYLNLSYVHDPKAQSEVRRLLKQLSAPYGVYAVLGSPPVDEREVILALFDDLPIRLLIDEWEAVDLGGGRTLVLLGMDCSHHVPTDAGRLEQLVGSSPNHVPRVLLYHAPDLMPQASNHDLDLYLCGHTHGGQVRLPLYGALLTSSHLGKRYEMGLYRQNRTHLYVSRGVGLEGLSAPRVRFLAPPEITLVTVKGVSAR